jgi:dipeptidyl aminopeptidase/acylaminoacyl peptidase
VRWKSFDGRTISGFLFRPPVSKFPGKRPVIINIHGGPEGQSRPSFMGRSITSSTSWASRDHFPNVRGSSGYGKEFLTLDNGSSARTRSRTSARCSTGSRRRTTWTPTASWSPAAATAGS